MLKWFGFNKDFEHPPYSKCSDDCYSGPNWDGRLNGEDNANYIQHYNYQIEVILFILEEAFIISNDFNENFNWKYSSKGIVNCFRYF